jgi:hypothetical protein
MRRLAPHLGRFALLASIGALGAAGCSSGPVDPNTAPSRTDHDQYFPISQGSHASAQCNDCHGDTDSFTQSTCTGCHNNQSGVQCPSLGLDPWLNCLDLVHADAGVGGYPDTCVRCHGNDEVWYVANHKNLVVGLSFDIGPASVGHYRQSCLLCHTSARTQPQAGHPAEPWTTDFTAVDCTQCHVNPPQSPPAGVADPNKLLSNTDGPHGALVTPTSCYRYDTNSCLACHPGGDFNNPSPLPCPGGS